MAEDWSTERFLTVLARAESASEHPLGKAIYDYAKAKVEVQGSCDEFRAVPGEGFLNERNVCSSPRLTVCPLKLTRPRTALHCGAARGAGGQSTLAE